MIAPVPLNSSVFVTDLSQPFDKIGGSGRSRKSQNCFDVGDTIESIEGSSEHFRCIDGTNQRIRFIGLSKELAGENIDSAAGGTVSLRFR